MDYIVRFSPSRPCTDPHCISMTNVGLAELTKGGCFDVTPYCPRHCFFVALRPSHEPEVRKSIENFVLSELGEQGKALEIKPALSDEVAKYNIKTCEADDAWRVEYQPVKGEPIICYVTWLDREEEFCLFRNTSQGEEANAARTPG
ncbi:hypothetical protein KSX_96690 [Ktedonospora formicarum]|uniref:Uncharacterized protein n=1 Tax=Ktedonospora formicarum TaxID=2778364 RepID=A0A8J3MZ12_9CHLR|nr:hypothetical protein KSX_96690 [Ktedonospora formicarum]